MATATLGLLNYTEIDDCDTTTNWNGDIDTLDPDIKKEGTNSMSGVLRADGDNGYVDLGTPPVTMAGKHLRVWLNTTSVPYMEDEAGGGFQVFVYDGTNTDYYVAISSDDYSGGWANVVIDCSLFTTVTAANVDRWGIYANYTTNAKNVINTWVDFFRYSDGYYVTGGGSSDKVRLSDVATADKGTTTLYGYGIVEEIEDTYFCSGKLQLGNGSTTTYFEMDGDVLVFTDKPVADGLYAINGNGSGADIVIQDSTIKAAGTGDDNRPDIDMVTSSPNSVSITGSVINRAGACTFTSGQTITSNIFNDCEQITHGGADMESCTIKGYEGTTGTGALVYNVNADIDGEIDGSIFTKGTASTHAIQFGTSAANTHTLRSVEVYSYNTTDQQTDSVLYFPDKGSDTTWTINLVGCTGTFSYYKARSGDTVSIQATVAHSLSGLVNGSEVTYMKLGTAEDTGTAGATTADDRTFTDSGKSWTTNQFQGRLLVIESGSDVGRYYISSNTSTTLELDTEMTTTDTSLDYSIYDENDMTEEYHVESVTGNSTSYQYNYVTDSYVDIMIQHVNYVEIVYLDVLLGNTDQTIPISQVLDGNYYNPT